MSKTKANDRLSVALPAELIDWWNQECEFLGIGQRIFSIDGADIQYKSELMRLIVNSYIERCLDVGQPDEPLEMETVTKNRYLPFYLGDRVSRGLWETAIRKGFAISYNQLVNRALTEYWDRQINLAEGVQVKLRLLQDLLSKPGFDTRAIQEAIGL